MDVNTDTGVLCSGVSAATFKVPCIDAEKLIKLVRGYPNLYVSSSRDFKDQLKKIIAGRPSPKNWVKDAQQLVRGRIN